MYRVIHMADPSNELGENREELSLLSANNKDQV